MTSNEIANAIATAQVLNAATELATGVIAKVAGGDIADTINNSPATRDTIRGAVLARLQSNLRLNTI